MNKAPVLLLAILVSGCGQEHLRAELDRCEGMWGEQCSLIAMPNSRFEQINDVAKGWAGDADNP
jgi:hypothetical protein